MEDYEGKLRREQEWYTNNDHRPDHFLNSRWLFSQERQRFNYRTAKTEMAKVIGEALKAHGPSRPSMLIAPVGTGGDVPFVEQFSSDITGVDISQEAIDQVANRNVKALQGDMRNLTAFPDNHFDIVLSPLFFHHFHDALDDFLIELHRVLKPGGHFITLEPSILHPFSWITRSAKRVFGNITGQVEDEAPMLPFTLTRAMRRSGFQDIRVRGASFSHNRIPIWLARINNVLAAPLRKAPVLKYFAWLCVFYGRKSPVDHRMVRACRQHAGMASSRSR